MSIISKQNLDAVFDDIILRVANHDLNIKATSSSVDGLQLSVERSGRSTALSIPKRDLMRFREELRKRSDKDRFVCNAQIISDDDMTIGDCLVKEDSVISVVERSRGVKEVKVESLDGRTIIVEVRKKDKIVNIEEKIKERIRFDRSEHRLEYRGVVLSYYDTIEGSAISEGSVIRVVKIPREKMMIYLRFGDGRVVPLTVGIRESIFGTKRKIQDKIGLFPDEQNLVFQGELLEDDKTLHEYHIVENSFVDLGAQSRGRMTIFAKSIDGKRVALEVTKYDTIMDIKKKIQEKIGVAPVGQKLVYKGGILEDEKTVDEYQIVEESVIDVVRRLTGGMQISAKTMEGKTFAIQVSYYNTIMDIKKKIQEKIGLAPEEQKLVYQGGILEDDSKTVDEYQIEEKSVINVVRRLTGMQISAKTMEGKTFAIQVSYYNTIMDIKKKIYEKIGLAPEEQILVYQGGILEDKKTVDDYWIREESVILVVRRLRGGMKIFARTMEGKTFAFEVEENATIMDIKKMIQEKIELEAVKQIFVHRGRILKDDNERVRYYNITENSPICVVTDSRDVFSINIKMADSPLVTLTVTSVDTIIELKERIKEMRGLSNVEVFIKVKGVTTENDCLTMLDCKIVKGDTIEVSTIERLTINIIMFNKESVYLEVLKSDRVADVKKKIEGKIGLLPQDQILLLRRRILYEDSNTVDQCQLLGESILVTARLRNSKEKIRGLCLVISNETFTNGSERRFGTRADEENIRRTFEPMGFETVIRRDVNQREMNVIFEETKNTVRESHSMLVVFILAHEEQGGFLTADDEFVPLADVYRHFTNVNFPSFADKPKLFFFAFCRGSERKAGACAARVPRLQYGGPSHDGGMFIGHATCMNDLSLRDTSRCTLYVQHLCDIIRENREWSVTEIHQEVQIVLSKRNIGADYWFQVPYCENGLTRRTCFIDEDD